MKERPILFSSEMVRAILEGRKTMTRRVIKPQPEYVSHPNGLKIFKLQDLPEAQRAENINRLLDDCPYGKLGDRLWVKETWQAYNQNGLPYSSWTPGEKDHAELYNLAVVDKATNPEGKRPGDPWIPSIFMPCWASRLTLEITDVKVEQVKAIALADIRAEGCPPEYWPVNCNGMSHAAYGWFEHLWDSINGAGDFNLNKWVWVISFKRVNR